ncbi:MAG: aldose epimerase family protein, partial [Nitriliruptoraceae bacterium]
IAGAEFRLDGRPYQLAAGEPPHALHGGPERGLSKVLWEVVRAAQDEVVLTYTSPDGEEGYPGRLQVTARYTLRGTALALHYQAVTDAATPVNLTNHAYWNLAGAGAGTVLDHELEVLASRFTTTDHELIPTGETAPVIGTALDFERPRRIGDRIDEVSAPPTLGYDHNLVLDDRSVGIQPAARLRDPASGRRLELETDQPGVQLYTGNRLGGHTGKHGLSYHRFGGVCLEPQYPPDAVHHPEFPSIILRPGETYEHNTVFRFSTD